MSLWQVSLLAVWVLPALISFTARSTSFAVELVPSLPAAVLLCFLAEGLVLVAGLAVGVSVHMGGLYAAVLTAVFQRCPPRMINAGCSW